MKVENNQNFSLGEIVLISSLPDMGRVGGLVTEHLKKTLTTKFGAKIILADKPWVNQKNGLVELPVDEYFLVVDEKNSLVIFTGQNQPQEPSTLMNMTDLVLSTVRKWGDLKLVISTGACGERVRPVRDIRPATEVCNVNH